MSIKLKGKKYTWCNHCFDRLLCGIGAPGFGCFAGLEDQYGPEPEKSEAVLCYITDDGIKPIREGTTKHMNEISAQWPKLLVYPTVVYPIETIFPKEVWN